MADLRPAARVPLLVLGMLSLVGGVLAGLARLDWNMPAVAANAAGWHGALMISAFLGTVISLERAVALGRGWAYAAPAAAGSGGIALLAGAPLVVTQVLTVVAAAILVAASIQVLYRLVAPFTVVLAIGALCWLIGNAAWFAGGALTAAVPWWLAFLVLTIAGERLELTRFLPTPAVAQRLFFAIVGGILAGAALSLGYEDAGLALFSAGLLALAVWLLRYDIARRNAQQQGLVRFIALCLLSGYAWLVLAGLLGWWRLPARPPVARCDAACGRPRLRLLDDLRPRADHLSGRGAGKDSVSPVFLPAAAGAARLAGAAHFRRPRRCLSAAQRGWAAECHRPASVHCHDDRQRGARQTRSQGAA
jgi:hypothetical protein